MWLRDLFINKLNEVDKGKHDLSYIHIVCIDFSVKINIL